MEAIIGKSYLTKIPHEGGEISFQYPSFEGTYEQIAEAIDRDKLERPTSPKTASLIYKAWKNKNGKFESEIIQILKNTWLWEFTGNLYLPKKEGDEIHNGVILDLDSQNLKFDDGKLVMDKSSLIKKLQNAREERVNGHPIFISEDGLTKFVPFGYKIEIQNLFEFQKNPYIVARYGKEGAEKIAEVASNYKNNPCVWSFSSVDEEKARMSALDGGWYFGGLLVVGYSWGDDDMGRAFGVVPKKTAAAVSV